MKFLQLTILALFTLFFIWDKAASANKLPVESKSYLKDINKIKASGEGYYASLAKYYKELANKNKKQHNLIAAEFFAGKGLFVINNYEVEPEIVEFWQIKIEDETELKKVRKNLIELITQKNKSKYPNKLSKMVVLFDCWIEELERKNKSECKKDFLKQAKYFDNFNIDKKYYEKKTIENLSKLKLIRSKPEIYKEKIKIIRQTNFLNSSKESYKFHLDKNISSEDERRIKKIAKDLFYYEEYQLVINSYNHESFKASLDKANIVKNILISNHINPNNITIFSFREYTEDKILATKLKEQDLSLIEIIVK